MSTNNALNKPGCASYLVDNIVNQTSCRRFHITDDGTEFHVHCHVLEISTIQECLRQTGWPTRIQDDDVEFHLTNIPKGWRPGRVKNFLEKEKFGFAMHYFFLFRDNTNQQWFHKGAGKIVLTAEKTFPACLLSVVKLFVKVRKLKSLYHIFHQCI